MSGHHALAGLAANPHRQDMADPFALPNDLDAIRADIWARWTRGGADRRSAFHTPVVASVDLDGAPEQRVMVLRKADPVAATLRFHTDFRSAKVAQLSKSSSISVVGYDSQAKIQIRASGLAVITHDDAIAEAAWVTTSISGRRCYLADTAPGSTSAMATSGLPAPFDRAMPTMTESEAGRANFAVLLVTVDRLEWLYLAASGHRRAVFTRDGNEWRGTWLVP
jgi:pyridoxamine 5'-phosphate oxidase